MNPFMLLLIDKLDALTITDIVITSVIALLTITYFLCRLKRKFAIIIYTLIFGTYLASLFVGLGYLKDLSHVLLVVFSIICVFENALEFRKLVGNFSSERHKKKVKAQTNIDRTELYKKIDDVVHILSKSKTGALLTFEKEQNMTDFMKNGVVINAPFSSELVQTIFYPGTRLHDGACVIRGDTIVAASVYYTPTTRALTGRYGSRHRAAFGISEVTDSVTVVVSEETGRVSLAYMGKLTPVLLDEFLSEFVDLMNKD